MGGVPLRRRVGAGVAPVSRPAYPPLGQGMGYDKRSADVQPPDGFFASGSGRFARLPPLPGRPKQRKWRSGLFRALALVAIITLPALLEPVAQEAALRPRSAAAVGSPGTPNRLPEPGTSY
jgi:hypothetical protein